jgi:Flp pilus assembly protein TadD
VDYCIWGLVPRGYHLTNILIHSLNGALAVWVTGAVLGAWRRRREGGMSTEDHAEADPLKNWAIPFGALLAGVLWAIHPQRVESVAWITERRDVVSGFFYLSCIACYLRSHEPSRDERGRGHWSLAAQLCCLAAVLSKATAVSLPVVLLVLDVYPLGRLTGSIRTWRAHPQREVFAEKLSTIVFALFGIGVGFLGQLRGGALRTLSEVGLLDRLALVGHAVIFYLMKLAVPADLTPMVPRPVPLNPLALRFLGSGLAALGITVALVALRRRWPGGLAAWVCYIAAVLPVSGLLTIGDELVADRYSYIASLIVAVAFGCIAAWAWERFNSHAARSCVGLAGVIAVAVCTGTAREYMPAWHDSVSLWEHAVKVTPNNAKALTNLGGSYALLYRYNDALKVLDAAVKAAPRAVKGHYNRGRVLLDLGRTSEAEQAFATAIRMDPNYLWAHEWRGASLLRLGRSDAAIAEFKRALQIAPSDVDVRLRLAEAYAAKKDFDSAAEVYEKLLTSDHRQPEVYTGLADVFLLQGRPDRADAVLFSVPANVAGDPAIPYAIARLRCRQHRMSEAIDALRGALLTWPDLRAKAKLDPLLADLRKDDRFDRLLAEVEAEVSRQMSLQSPQRPK